MLSNYGTYPSWSPYKGDVIRTAITFNQNNKWYANTYVGPWIFLAFGTDRPTTQLERVAGRTLRAGRQQHDRVGESRARHHRPGWLLLGRDTHCIQPR